MRFTTALTDSQLRYLFAVEILAKEQEWTKTGIGQDYKHPFTKT